MVPLGPVDWGRERRLTTSQDLWYPFLTLRQKASLLGACPPTKTSTMTQAPKKLVPFQKEKKRVKTFPRLAVTMSTFSHVASPTTRINTFFGAQ